MPFSIHIDPVHRVSYVRMSDMVTFDDLAAAQRAPAGDQAFDPTFPLLLDLRDADDVRLTWREMHSLAGVSALAPSTRRAILVGGPGVLGMARLYGTIRENETATDVVRVCQTLDEAAAWLMIDGLESLRRLEGVQTRQFTRAAAVCEAVGCRRR